MPNGSKMIKEKLYISKADYKPVGKELAGIIIEQGAVKLLKEAEEVTLKEIL